MKRYKRLVVPIGLRNLDLGAIRWASRIARLAGSEHVLFIHAADVPEIPEETQKRYPWLMAPLAETIQNEMEALVSEGWNDNENTKISYKTTSSKSESSAILSAVLEDDSDLIILGRGSFGGGMAQKLARKAPCSVMAIPTTHADRLKRILVPTDFSDHSRNGLDVAIAFAEIEKITKIDSLHVFNTDAFHHKVTLPMEDQIGAAESFATEMHQQFLNETDTRGVEVVPHIVCDRSVPMAMNRLVRELDIDLVVTSCRGKNAMSSWLLGSNAESLLENSPVPIIAAKVKGTGLGLLESILHG